MSYGSYIADLFEYVERNRAVMRGVKTIVYGGDSLPANIRRIIVERWRIQVMSVYQAVEVANIAFDCGEGQGLHVNVDLCPVRIVDADGVSCPAGTPGEVVVSNLVNRATVLLNYRIGDLASLLPRQCACGRSLPLLSYVDGRRDDWLARPDGTLVHPQSVCQAFRANTMSGSSR